ncbi:hypothetical protein SRHO_G00175770 [Serrasalmus rhombeus]
MTQHVKGEAAAAAECVFSEEASAFRWSSLTWSNSIKGFDGRNILSGNNGVCQITVDLTAVTQPTVQ